MPTIDMFNAFEEKNLYALNYKQLRSRVQSAMRKSGEEREAALKEAFLKSYAADAKKYERLRQELKMDAKNDFSMDEGLRESIRDMASAPLFYKQYAELFAEMAKEIDQNYTPKPFLGVSLREAVRLQEEQLGSYTRRDQTAYSMKKYVSREDLVDEAEFVRNDHVNEGATRDYKTMHESVKGNARELYVRKELVREELKNAGFFWRLFHRSEVREKRAYIRLAEEVLEQVHFPEEAKVQAVKEHNATSVIADEEKLSRRAMADAYGVPEELASRFESGKRPEPAVDAAALEAYTKANKTAFRQSGKLRLEGKTPKEVGFFPGANAWSNEMYTALVNEYNREVDGGMQPDALRERNLERIAQQIRIDIGVISQKKAESIYDAWDKEDMASFMQQSSEIKENLKKDVKEKEAPGLSGAIENPVHAKVTEITT